MPLDENSFSNTKGPYNLSAPPIPESNSRSLRAAGRALSFGRKKADVSAVPAPAPRPVDFGQSKGHENIHRPRAMTESSRASESTATPPKFLDGGLDLGQSDLDSFGSMFDNFGKRQSRLVEEPATLGGIKTESSVRYGCLLRVSGFANITKMNMFPAGSRGFTKSQSSERLQDAPSPIHVDQSREIQATPRSWASEDSQAGLMANKTQRGAEALSYYNKYSSAGQAGQGPSKSRTMPLPGSTSPSNRKTQQPPPSIAGGGLRRSSVYASKRESTRDSDGLRNEDARLVMDSLSASRRLNRQSGAFGGSKDSDDEADNPAASLVPESPYPSPYGVTTTQTMPQFDSAQQSPAPLFDSSDQDFSATSWRPGSTDTTPRAKKSDLVQQEERSLFDASPPLPDRSAPLLSRVQPPQQSENKNKVMTPAQFERYRKEQEARGDQYSQKDDSDEEGDDYDDDDEIEWNKQLARERRKQEAHLSVYRQQMMKVTGEQPSDLPRPGIDRASMSAPTLGNRSNTPTFSFDKSTEAGKASDDEDEDIPLGVLAAHGFPSKSRPPTASSSHIQYKSESYPPPPASVAGTSAAGGGRSGLPPFARHLPPDPYFGAGLVNPSNRESLAFGHGGPSSARGGSDSVYGGAQPSMQHGGLVGVIAGEERAKAARRGSPNAQGTYGSHMPPGMMQMPMGMPGMPPLLMTPGEKATVQMSEQMNQMMQMQMQWMQQMQQMMENGMQGISPGQQPPFMMPPQQEQMMLNAGMLAAPSQQQRPMTMGSPISPGALAGPQQAHQRAMSMMTPASTPSWPPQGNNRMSKAPCMMSGALKGPGPGYAPSITPSERSNVGTPSRYRPVSIAPSDEHVPRASSRSSAFTSGMLQPGENGRNSRMSTSGDRQSKLSFRPVSREPLNKSAASDDDDEEGWEEMKQKREKKKSTWRLKKERDDRGGLDLYDYPDI